MFRRTIILAVGLLAPLTPAASAQFLEKGTSEWAADLQSGNDSRRRNAAFALGNLGQSALAAAPALKRAAATDKNAKVREAACFALGEIAQSAVALGQDEDLQAVLTRLLGDRDPLVRRSAVFALGSLGSDAASARAAVEAILRDERPEVRQNAAWALGRFGEETIPALRRSLADADALVLRDAAGSLGQLDGRACRIAMDELAALATHRDVEVKKAALFALVGMVKPADAKASALIAPLQKALLDGDEEVRRNAAFALCNIRGEAAVPAVDVVLEALRIGDVNVKRQAAAALGNIGPAAHRAVPELVNCLSSDDPELRANSAVGLGGIGAKAEAAVAPLTALVGERLEPPGLRAQAAVALSMIGDVKPAVAAVPKLLAVVSNPDDDGKVRERVMWALRVHNVNLRTLPGAAAAFKKILVEPTTPENRMVRQDCAYVYAMVWGPKSPPEVFPVLLEYLKDETVQVYRNTATLVGGAAQETTAGKTSSRELGEGDGRKLVLDALAAIGTSAVRNHPEIIDQIHALADSDRTAPRFRQQCKAYLRVVAP